MSLNAQQDNAIYFDYQSTTPVDSRVLQKMLPYFSEKFANASSAHEFGLSVDDDVEEAREQIALSIGAKKNEIVFTSGATESNHLALSSLIDLLISSNKRHIIVSAIEHKSVLDLAISLKKKGFTLTILPVTTSGFIELDVFKNSLRKDTGLVSIMTANNEIGTIQPINEIAEQCAINDLIFHTDAAQAIGRVPFDVNETKCLLASLSAHKIYGPKGVGALYVRGNASKMGLLPMFLGGNQENGMRSGTTNVPGIIGFAEAIRIAKFEIESDNSKARRQLKTLWDKLKNEIDGIKINGGIENRLPNNLNVCIEGVDSDALISGLANVAVSNGSACTARTITPSHVLNAIGLSDEESRSSIRIGVGRNTTDLEIECGARKIIEQVKRLRG